MPKASRTKLASVEKELARIGLLLQHDAELPSVTTLLVGGPIAGSWWGHARGNELYALLTEFEHGAGGLCVKLVNAKLTYVAARLWPAWLTLVQAGETKRVAGLSAAAKALRKRVLAAGTVRGDEVPAKSGSAKEFAGAVKELEAGWLAHVDSVHTASGAHTKVLQPWSAWADAQGVAGETTSVAQARAEFEQALELLSQGVKRRPKLALLEVSPASAGRK